MTTKTSPTTVRIAIQKSGRLTEKTLNLLKGIGLSFDDYKRNLLVKARNFDVELLLIRDDDIPEYVQDGVCDLGFVGANVRAESGADVKVLRGLNYGTCRLSIAVPKDSGIESPKDLDGKRIATSYPNLTNQFLKANGVTGKIVNISGAVEIAPRLQVADVICDLVSTGGTLKANGLVESFRIFDSETELVQTNQELSAEKQELIEKFLTRIEGHLKAKESRYIMMNAPVTALNDIKKLVPSLKSPTIVPLADDDKTIAIHTVIPYNKFWEIMENLKDLGATDIVILPIESMIL